MIIKWIEKIGTSTKDLLEKAQNGLNSVLDNRQKNETDDKWYKTITAILGLTTTVLNPIIELIIFFLPEIISFFSGKSKEEKQKELVLQKISSEVIPNIKRKVREAIPELFNNYLKNTIELISNEFEVQLIQKQKEIELTQSEKESNIKDIEQQLINLENIKKELQNLTTQYLYN